MFRSSWSGFFVMDKKTNAVKIIEKTDDYAIVGGYGVIFGGEDLEGETFTPDTDFMPDLVPVKLVMYDHSLSEVKNFIGKTTSEKSDDIGNWVEAQLDRHKDYINDILELVEAGVLGWSSGSVGHLIEREGKTIKRWPIVEYSLTPTPAEPRTLGVERIKQLAKANPSLEALLPQEPGEGSSADATAADEPNANKFTRGVKSMDEKQVYADAAVAEALKVEREGIAAKAAAEKAVIERIDTAVAEAEKVWESKLPPINDPGTDAKVIKDEADHEFATSGEFFMAVKNAAFYPGARDVRLKSHKATGLSEGEPADGGYLLSPQVAGGIIEIKEAQ